MKAAKKTISDWLAVAIREAILSGEFSPGAPLRQDMLADHFNVSRIPVREALFQLEAEGLVAFHPHRGALVRAMSLAEAEDIFGLRLLVEPELVAAAAAKRDGAVIKCAKDALAALDGELAENGSTPQASTLHWAFHRALYQACARERSVEVLDRLYVLSERYIRLHLRQDARAARSRREHKGMLAACAAGDATAASAAIRSHIAKTLADLRKSLTAQGAASGKASAARPPGPI